MLKSLKNLQVVTKYYTIPTQTLIIIILKQCRNFDNSIYKQSEINII